jgi:penicillin-binding protein 1A
MWGSVWNAGFRIPSGGKTGTTNDGTDVWYIGYTADLVAGVWMGLDRPQRIKTNAQGGILAAPAWTGFMKEVYTRKPAPPDWPRPESIISREVDKMTGLSRNPFCPTELVYTEHYIPGTEPIRECDAHSPFSIFGDTGSTLAPDTTGQGGVRITPGVVPIPRPSRPAIPDSLNPFHIPTTPEPVTPAPANPGPAAPAAAPSPAPSQAPDRAPFVPSESERPADPPPR